MRYSQEENIQRYVVQYINEHYPNALYTHCPNGGKRHLTTAIKFKQMGVRAGVPDLLFFDPINVYTGLAIELKAGKNDLEVAQREWLARLAGRGYKVAVCWSYEEAVAEIDEYYALASKTDFMYSVEELDEMLKKRKLKKGMKI